jgi:hypothetical protein
MFKKYAAVSLSSMLMLPAVGLAATGIAGGDETGAGLGTFISNAVAFINTILIPAVLALAFLFFVWGIFLFFIAGGADDEKKAKGKSLMFYAIGGFVLILVFFGVVNLLVGTIGTGGETLKNIPGGPIPAAG